MRAYTSVDQPSFDEWLTLAPVQILRTSDALASDVVHVYSAHINPNPDYLSGPKTDDEFIVVLLNGQNYLESTVANANGHIAIGSMQIVSRGMDYKARWHKSSRAAFIQIPRVITNDVIATEGRGDPENVEIPFTFNHRDPLLFHMCQALVKQIETSSPHALYAESLIHTITAHLLCEYSKTTLYRAAVGKLTLQQKNIIEEYIYTNLDKNFSIAELAHVLHLSTSHFQRVFRSTFQCSPHQYILERQIEKAKSLLLNSRLSLYEIARECGFANQSHFTKYFSRLVGVSPTRFADR